LFSGRKHPHKTARGNRRKKTGSIPPYPLVKSYLTKRPGEATAKKRAAFPLIFRSKNTRTKRPGGTAAKKTGSIPPYPLVKSYLTKRPGEAAAKKRAAFPLIFRSKNTRTKRPGDGRGLAPHCTS
jgi:hypothetical protein